jgi:hypothetical protein
VLIHDNDLIIEFDNNLFEKLLTEMIKNEIDRCIFGVAAKSGPSIIKLTDDDSICRINNIESSHFLLPFDVGPSVWKVQSYKEALLTSPNTSYRDIEMSPVRDYCIQNLNIYGFISHKTIPSCYVVGRPFYYKFQLI